jgi:hypothetical protein
VPGRWIGCALGVPLCPPTEWANGHLRAVAGRGPRASLAPS